MSPTSYLAAPPRDVSGAGDRGRTGTVLFKPQDFKSCASACSATPAYSFFLHRPATFIIIYYLFYYVNSFFVFIFYFFIASVLLTLFIIQVFLSLSTPKSLSPKKKFKGILLKQNTLYIYLLEYPPLLFES